jgi:hypothetical protein
MTRNLDRAQATLGEISMMPEKEFAGERLIWTFPIGVNMG